MSKYKQRANTLLKTIREGEQDKTERAYRRSLNFKRLLFLAPFLIAALVFLLLSLE